MSAVASRITNKICYKLKTLNRHKIENRLRLLCDLGFISLRIHIDNHKLN